MKVLKQVEANEADERVIVGMRVDMVMQWKCDANEVFFFFFFFFP